MVAAIATKTDKKQEDKWRAEDDARSLRFALEVIDDPSRLEKARKILNEQAQQASRLAGKCGVIAKMKSTH